MFIFKFILRFVLTPFVLIKNIFLYAYGYIFKSNNDCINSLRKNGFYFFDKTISADDLNQFFEEFNRLLELHKISSSGQDNGRIVFGSTENAVVKNFIDFAQKKACEYFNTSFIEPDLLYFQTSKPEDINDNVPGGAYHMDDNKKNLKFFIYMNDVYEENGPFIYAPNTHGFFSINKLYRWFLWELTLKRSALYQKPSHTFKHSVDIVGAKGSIFCADTTGYHKAKSVKAGQRSVFVVSFAETRFDPYRLANI
ncbi:MAG: hypothetical protein ACI9YE_002831 [Psychroserpens sp.]|jgi:hypothetical protein